MSSKHAEMSTRDEVFAAALALPEVERAKLANQLLDSLAVVDDEAAEARRMGIAGRAREVDEGNVALLHRDEGMGELRPVPPEHFARVFDQMVVRHLGAQELERACQKGFEKGFARVLDRRRTALLDQLARRFGALPQAIPGGVARAGSDSLDFERQAREADEGKAQLLDRVEVMAELRPVPAPGHSTLNLDQILVWNLGWRELEQAYKRGFEEGFERALALWRATVLRLLGRRFGVLPTAYPERVAHAGTDDLDRWGALLIDAASLDDVFAAP
jgi:hypothetical protein